MDVILTSTVFIIRLPRGVIVPLGMAMSGLASDD